MFYNAACVGSVVDRLMHGVEVARIDGTSNRAEVADERDALGKAERATKAPATRTRKGAR